MSSCSPIPGVSSSTSRRRFLGHACAGACACAWRSSSVRSALASGDARPAGAPPLLLELSRDSVQLTAGPLLTQFDQQQRLFMSIDDDRLLKPFRLRAGQPAPGADMGGWYDQSTDFHIDPSNWSTANWHGFIPGHGFGQYLSGLARAYAITHSAATRAKVAGLVSKYAQTISPRFFADYNLPAYTYDKLVVGLVDAFRHAGAREARVALDRLTDAALPFLAREGVDPRGTSRAPLHTRGADLGRAVHAAGEPVSGAFGCFTTEPAIRTGSASDSRNNSHERSSSSSHHLGRDRRHSDHGAGHYRLGAGTI